MLFTNCFYDAELDISPVVPMLDIDLEQCLLTGIVPGDGVIPEFNGIEDSDSIVGRIYDPFDAIDHQRNLNNAMSVYRAKMSETSNESTASAAE